MVKKIGNNAANTLIGTGLDDQLFGLGGNDVLKGKGGDDKLYGGAGNDKLYGANGDDKLEGGAGNDQLFGGNGDDKMKGGAGNDTLTGGNGDDKLEGGNGDDSLSGGDGVDNMKGGAGNDRLASGSDDDVDVIDGGNGIDTVDYSSSTERVVVYLEAKYTEAGALGDNISNVENVVGSAFNDSLQTGLDGRAEGRDGDDELYAFGAATLDGGDGNDTLFGGGDTDTLIGGAGNDQVFAAAGNDDMDGGEGADRMVGGQGADTMTGGAGPDVFDFNIFNETGLTAATRDVILDFSQADGDKIDVATIDAFVGGANDAFIFVAGSNPIDSLGPREIGYFYDAVNNVTIVHGELANNGLTTADFTIELKGNIVLTAADFVL